MNTKRTAIIGMGKSGRAALRLIKFKTPQTSVATFDHAEKSAADFHDPEKLLNSFQPERLIVSPGVPLNTLWIQKCARNHIELTSELDLASEYLNQEKLFGVTGSLGKSTTVSLIEHGLKTFDTNAVAVGNIGYPLADYICDVSEKIRNPAQHLVVELSSYQLENLNNLRFDFSAITFLSENHLDRYSNKNDYYQTKWHLSALTRHRCVLNVNGGDLLDFHKSNPSEKSILSNSPTIYPRDSQTNFESASLIGQHNQDNILVAWTLGKLAGLPDCYFKGLLDFKGLAHRLEFLGTYNEKHFINDSKATSIDGVFSAVKSTQEAFNKAGLHLLLGGKDKNLPWHKLNSLNSEKNIHFYFFGTCATKAKAQSQLSGPVFSSLEDLVPTLPQTTRTGDVILLSPGGTSLDEFENFEDRGNKFSLWVKRYFGVT